LRATPRWTSCAGASESHGDPLGPETGGPGSWMANRPDRLEMVAISPPYPGSDRQPSVGW
jgi:hypothetical protein